MKQNFNYLVADFGLDSFEKESEEGLRFIRDLGFSGVYPQDLFCVMDPKSGGKAVYSSPEETIYARSEAGVREFRDAVRKEGLTMESAHFNQMLPPPGEPVDWIFESHDILVQLAALAGLKRFTTHMGWMHGLTSLRYLGSSATDFSKGKISLRQLHAEGRKRYGGLEAMVDDSVLVYRNLCDLAKAHDITVTIETACIEALEVNADAQAFLSFIERVDRENLKVCLDPGHCQWNNVDPVELSRALGDRIVEVHFHDNFGDEDSPLPVGQGSIPWEELIRALESVDYAGNITFEQRDHAANQQFWKQLQNGLQ